MKSGRHVGGVHLREKRLNLAHRQAARIQRNDLVVEAGETPFVLADQPRLETALAIARHLDGQRAIVGQHRLLAGAVAVIGRLVRRDPAGGVAEVMRQLAAEARSITAFLKRRTVVSSSAAVIGPWPTK
jgi:hypothetical protein